MMEEAAFAFMICSEVAASSFGDDRYTSPLPVTHFTPIVYVQDASGEVCDSPGLIEIQV